MSLLKEIKQGLAHLIFPRLCEGCSEPLMSQENTLCLSCLQELPHTNYGAIQDNEAAIRFAGRVPYQHVTALSIFTPNGLLQHLLHELKYKNKQTIGHFLGRQLGYDLQKYDWVKTIDLIVPIPLHAKKEAKRGYNQSDLIAQGIGEVLGKNVAIKAIKRIRYTESQTTKTREERLQNMRDAFSITDPSALAHKHVLLIDDVLTTGATIEAAALTLLKAPGVQLSIATIGIAAG